MNMTECEILAHLLILHFIKKGRQEKGSKKRKKGGRGVKKRVPTHPTQLWASGLASLNLSYLICKQ